MTLRWARHPASVAVLLGVLLLLCGAALLADMAPRDWSLHWVAPRTLKVGISTNDYALTPAVYGWDLLWSDFQNHLVLSRIRYDGTRAGIDTPLDGSSRQFALTSVAGRDVAVWREDLNGSSRIRFALVASGSRPRYGTLVRGTQPLEHPIILPTPGGVAVIFGWERPNFDLYLSKILFNGHTTAPVRLTHAAGYALLPRALIDAHHLLRLIWLDRSADGSAFNLLSARFTLDGRRRGNISQLDAITSASGADHQSTPARWGLSLTQSGNTTLTAWSGDQGIMLATWNDAGQVHSHVVVPVPASPALTLAVTGAARELVWQQATDTGAALFTEALNIGGGPIAPPDRVAFEPAFDAQPTQARLDGQPAVVWVSTPGNGSATRLEISHYIPQEIGPRNLWERFGLGLANPFASLAFLLAGSVAVAVLLTVGNVLLIFLLVVLFLLISRLVKERVRWYGYAAFLGAAMYLLLITLQAPFPPVVAFTAFSPGIGLLSIIGMTATVLIVSHTWLRRVDDLYRAALMTFIGFYFLAFLQALVIVQGQIGKI